MTGLVVLFIAAGLAGIVLKDRVVRYEASPRNADESLVRTQVLIGSGIMLIMGLLLLGFRLDILRA